MVTTRAKGVFVSCAGGQRQGADPLAVGPSALPAGVPTPSRLQTTGHSAPPVDVSAPPPQQLQEDRLATLATQVQSLAAAVQGLQHQQAAPRQPEPFHRFRGWCNPASIPPGGDRRSRRLATAMLRSSLTTGELPRDPDRLLVTLAFLPSGGTGRRQSALADIAVTLPHPQNPRGRGPSMVG